MTRNSSRLWVMFVAAIGGLAWMEGPLNAGHAQTQFQFPADGERYEVRARVIAPVDDAKRVTLAGNVHYLARPEFDKGPADSQLELRRMVLVLKRSPEQEAALERFMAEQYDPKSPNFHHWLEPEEFGRLYGPADADVAAVTGWLENHGFRIYQVSKGRVTIEFSGTVDQVRRAFGVETRRYLVDGQEHIANDRDPEVPAALAPVIAGIASLNDFFPRHQSILGRFVRRNRKTGEITPVDEDEGEPAPMLTYTDSNNKVHEDVSPWDFATIYNLIPQWNDGIDGSGQSVALAAVSDIEQSDVDTFRSSFGLPASTVEQIHNGSDPGVLAGASVENTLDAEWAGAAGKNATVKLVVSASQATTFGGQLSMSYIVDNKAAPVMSASYGNCEGALGAAGNSLYNGIYQQGAAEGISIFVSAGDQGSTGCDETDGAADTPAKHGLQVNGLASSPWVTAVGGTDFNYYASNLSQYWKTSNAGDGATAKGYVPEVPWDSTCTSGWLLAGSPNYKTSYDICAYASYTPAIFGLYRVAGGSGGVSACTSISNGDLTTCSGGYGKPGWQAGTGVPADGKRDLPDLALFASDGFPDGIVGSAYLLCVAANDPNGCDYSDPSYIIYQEVGGTSVASPAMAGIMSLVLQKMSGQAQGLANPVLYALAGKENYSSCAAGTVSAGNGCVFYDITSGTNAQVCVYGSLDCYTPSGYAIGIVTVDGTSTFGYNAGFGYDLATGLGSVNATNLVNAWGAAAAPAISLSPGKLSFANTSVGSSSAAQTVTVQSTGAATLHFTGRGVTVAGADAGMFPMATTCAKTLADGAKCTVTVTLKPSATGSFSATLEVADNASGSPQKVALSGTGISAATLTLSPSTIAFPNTVEGSASETQMVTVKNATTSTITLTSISIAGAGAQGFAQVNDCGASLAVGASCNVYVAFTPSSAKSFAAALSVADNAPHSPQTASLTGTGTAPPSVKLSKTSLNFGSIAKGSTSEEQSVTLTNAGSAALSLASIALGGADPASFEELNDCPGTLAAGTNCQIYVVFKPGATGALSATLSITDDGSASPQKVALTGTGH